MRGAVGSVVGAAVGALSGAGAWYVGSLVAAPRCPSRVLASSPPPPPPSCDSVELSSENLGTAAAIVLVVTQVSAIAGGMVGVALVDDDDRIVSASVRRDRRAE